MAMPLSRKMKNYLWGILFSVATLFLAIDGLTITAGDVAPINLFWGFIYGFGWFMAANVLGNATFGPHMFFWGKIWTFVLLPVLIIFLFAKLLSKFPQR